MKLIKKLMGRRQFLIGAGAASMSTLAFKKLAGVVAPNLQTNGATPSYSFTSIAMGEERSGTAGAKGTNNRYSHLLSPLKIRNVLLKNRMMWKIADPHFLQGPETYPSEEMRTFYANLAKTAAIVYVRMGTNQLKTRKERNPSGDGAHMIVWDFEDPAVENYLDQMIEGVHCMGSLVYYYIRRITDITGKTVNEAVESAKKLEGKGSDMVSFAIDFKNKDSLPIALDQMQGIQRATNLIILMRGIPSEPSEAIAMAKMFEGSADIALLSGGGATMGYNMSKGKPSVLKACQAIKESGAKIIVCANAGFLDPDFNEEFIASGKLDMVCLARPFVADPDYGKKVYDGRGEDIIPCIMCNKCHGLNMKGPWYSVCSVNPQVGITTAVRAISAPTGTKKVAVIGGGPAGMEAALVAAGRGHKVTLYEKNDYLGGMLRHSDFSPLQWPLKDFKDYMVRQLGKAGVEVQLKTAATLEMVNGKGYDAVLVAIGTEPVIPRIPGVDGKNVYNVVNVYGREKELGKNVVVVGGGKFSVQTGMYLAKIGHDVTVLTSEKELVAITGPVQTEVIVRAYKAMKNFTPIVEVTTRSISPGKVTYVDAKGAEKSINADSVIIYAGLKPRMDEAMKFYGSAKKQFLIIGDCSGKGGDLQRSIRSAFFAASQV